MTEIETFNTKDLFPEFSDYELIADSFVIGKNSTEAGLPYMVLIAAINETREMLHLPMPVGMAEKLGWSLIESAQKFRIIHGEG